ncbi:MAG: DNA primase [Oscillospiraceae bacterium]|nr:DNA primase [Oscillospiraceae bacterium]
MATTKSATVNEVTDSYLSSLDLNNLPPPETIEAELLSQTCAVFEIENMQRPKGQKWQMPQTLFNIQIARLLAHCENVVCIAAAGLGQNPVYDLIGIYMDSGKNEGTYVTDANSIRGVIAKYNSLVSQKDIDEILRWLRLYARRVELTQSPGLVAVENGIFNLETRTLMPFSPEYIFTTKSHTKYNAMAKNSVLTNPDGTLWDIESWIKELSDDPEIVNLLWKVIGAVLRPYTRWDKSVWLYSEVGSNGKGTLCALMRNLLGENAYASISLSDFSKEFMLEPLMLANAVISDENDVGVFLDKAANFKAVVTGDEIQINRKFQSPIAFKFHGLVIQCANETPRVKDKSSSFYRRLLIIPFEKSFTGAEKKFIKSDYMARAEVLEYVLYKVLNMDFNELPEPEACRQLLEDYRQFNDPVRQFVDEILPQLVWSLVPREYLYDLYKAWFSRNIPSGIVQGKITFLKEIEAILRGSDTWYVMSSKDKAKRADKYMTAPEPLSVSYNLQSWFNPNYSGNDVDKIAIPPQTGEYRGLLRK